MKFKILLVVLVVSVFTLNAQSNKELAYKYLKERGELVFSFTANNFKEIEELNRIISFDRGRDRNNPLKVSAVANKKNFEKFLTFNLPFEVNVKANEPKDVVMFDPKIHKKGFSGKNAAYPLSFPLSTYPTYQQYADQMAAFAADHSDIAELIDIGGTVQGDKRLLFIKLSDNVATREAEPRVMYTSSMHGDEVAGFPAMLNLIDYFITAYKNTGHSDHTRVKNLIDNSEVWINPMANPDATYWMDSTNTSVADSRRENANNVDLNRNYPDNIGGAHPDGEAYQTETLAFMQFASDYHFVLSANLHGGIELVNYPFDNAYASATRYHSEDPSGSGPYYTHPDTDWYEYVSVEYASQAQSDSPSGYMTTDEDSYIYPSPGVTHGAEWYRVYGGRQDYMNFYHQCREITVEISDVKTPPSTNTSSNNEVIDIWNYNQEAYIKFLIQGMYGFRGIVKDATTGTPIDAKIYIVGRDDKATPITNSWVETEVLFNGTESGLGDFYRPIEAGNYDILIEANADCYIPITLNRTISNYETVDLGDILLQKVTDSSPSNAPTTAITTTTATLNWDNINGASNYSVRYREQGTSIWTTATSGVNSLDISGLSVSTTYEFQVNVTCNSNTSTYSTLTNFTTLAANYCDYAGDTQWETGVTYVNFNTLTNSDGPTKDVGYEHFSNTTEVDLGESHTLTVRVNTDGNYTIHAFAYIDFNGDGSFVDVTAIQEIYDLGQATNGSDIQTSITPNILIPSGHTGSVRMRIAARYSQDPDPDGCNTSTFDGEVEDYTLNIIDSTLGIQDEILSTFNLYPNPSNIGEVRLTLPNEIQDFNIDVYNLLGQKLLATNKTNRGSEVHTIDTSKFRTGVYFVTVSTELGSATKKLIIE
ncbi:M14 family zinc carboxypeptidase [uncultured Lutibacter sp.]|uniref:M14 family zinc carboxypeptidase n=1 Tax=uncultured Lutibacter sp. TaxID=437739 RepID=UPI0026105F55|nr:M14 family zinc carboxypeptidase [uncultured Lutibacter sp.]